MKTIRLAVAVPTGATLALGLLLGLAPTAQAAYVVTFSQDGQNVVANGSGTLDVSSLSKNGSSPSGGGMASFDYVIAGNYKALDETTGTTSTSLSAYDQYGTVTSESIVPVPTSTIALSATSGSGDTVGILDTLGSQTNLIVPYGYASGSALSGTATYANTTISDLGLAPGSYVWTWGTGTSADSYTLNIDAAQAVPEPSAAALLLLPLMLTGMIAARRKSR